MFKELFESGKRLTFNITDSALFGGQVQSLLEDFYDDGKITFLMEKDMANSWISRDTFSPAELKANEKAITKALPSDFKKGTYKFGSR